jgi:tRNA(Glu) U13 pseudouridine synthase TruD
MTPDTWREGGKNRVSGGRRAMRFRPMEVSVESSTDDAGEHIELRFMLDSGCYATAVLREICKVGEPIEAGAADE